jgi:hypothetical protein
MRQIKTCSWRKWIQEPETSNMRILLLQQLKCMYYVYEYDMTYISAEGEVGDGIIRIRSKKEGTPRMRSTLVGTATEGVFRKTTYYAYLGDYIYGYMIEPSEDSGLDPQFTYFVAFTGVGISDEAKRTIESVHFKLEFECLDTREPKIEIVNRAPSDENKIVGKITESIGKTRETSGQASAEVEAKFENDMVKAALHAGGKIGGKIMRKNESQRLEQIAFDRYYARVTSGGQGETVFWDFLQGKEVGYTGQYDVNIWFKIRKLFKEIKHEGAYRVMPTVKVNKKTIKDETTMQDFKGIPLVLITKES